MKQEKDICKVNMKRVLPYIHGELSNEETEEFLEHIKSCPNCRDELDIYFAIEIGLNEAEQKPNLSIPEALRDTIDASYHKLRAVKTARIFYYALNTLVLGALLVMLLLQFRIWFLT